MATLLRAPGRRATSRSSIFRRLEVPRAAAFRRRTGTGNRTSVDRLPGDIRAPTMRDRHLHPRPRGGASGRPARRTTDSSVVAMERRGRAARLSAGRPSPPARGRPGRVPSPRRQARGRRRRCWSASSTSTGSSAARAARYLLDFLDALTVPVVTTLHTILAHPTPLQRRILERLAERSARLVSMSERGRTNPRRGLRRPGRSGGGHPARGAGLQGPGSGDWPRRCIGIGDGPLILSFGLLGPHKRLGLVIDALARIGGDVAEARYAVVGATHPDIRRRSGRDLPRGARSAGCPARAGGPGSLRESLRGRCRARDLAVGQRHLRDPLRECPADHLGDACLRARRGGRASYRRHTSTPSSSSAMGAASSSRSTMLMPLAQALTRLLTDKSSREGHRRRARALGRTMIWPRVAERYSRLFAAVVARKPRERRRAGGAGSRHGDPTRAGCPRSCGPRRAPSRRRAAGCRDAGGLPDALPAAEEVPAVDPAPPR